MSNRMKSIELMSALRPFLQGGVITPAFCKEMVDEYITGSSEKLRKFVYSPDIPMQYASCIERVATFVQ